MGKKQHVTPHPKGGWQVKGAGNTRATLRTRTQKEAESRARTIAKHQHAEVVIHQTDGRIRKKTRTATTLFRPKDKQAASCVPDMMLFAIYKYSGQTAFCK